MIWCINQRNDGEGSLRVKFGPFKGKTLILNDEVVEEYFEAKTNANIWLRYQSLLIVKPSPVY